MNPHCNPYKKKRTLPVGHIGLCLPQRTALPKLETLGLDHGEAEFFYCLAVWMGGGHLVNLGDGGSATLWALALQDHDLPGHVTTVDFYDEKSARRVARERDNLCVSDRITLLRERTATAREKITQPCNLLFIDADHSYENVLEDYLLYSSLVDGYLAFHDVNQEPTNRVLREQVEHSWELLLWVNRIKVYRRRL